MNGWASILLCMCVILGPLVLFVCGVVGVSVYQYRRDRDRRRAEELLTADQKERARSERQAAYDRGVAYGRRTAHLDWADEDYADPEAKNRWELLSECLKDDE